MLIELPEETIPGGPWYTFVPADVDLSEFSVPEVNGDPVVLTGVEIPQQSRLTVFHMTAGLQNYRWKAGEVAGYYYFVDGDNNIEYRIGKETADGDWIWWALAYEG